MVNQEIISDKLDLHDVGPASDINKQSDINEQSSTDKILKIVRGLHGSGKTQKANEILAANPAARLASVDKFFERSGDYHFVKEFLPRAYAVCEGMVDAFMEEGVPIIVVDGSHPCAYHLKPYVQLASLWGYKIEIVYPDGDIWNVKECAKHSVHKIPEYTIKYLARIFERDIDLTKLVKEAA